MQSGELTFGFTIHITCSSMRRLSTGISNRSCLLADTWKTSIVIADTFFCVSWMISMMRPVIGASFKTRMSVAVLRQVSGYLLWHTVADDSANIQFPTLHSSLLCAITSMHSLKDFVAISWKSFAFNAWDALVWPHGIETRACNLPFVHFCGFSFTEPT